MCGLWLVPKRMSGQPDKYRICWQNRPVRRGRMLLENFAHMDPPMHHNLWCMGGSMGAKLPSARSEEEREARLIGECMVISHKDRHISLSFWTSIVSDYIRVFITISHSKAQKQCILLFKSPGFPQKRGVVECNRKLAKEAKKLHRLGV